MVLHREHWKCFVANAFHRSVVQVEVRDLEFRRARDPVLAARALEARRCLDLSGPDRNPFLHDIMLATRLGWLPADSILRDTTDCEELWEWAEGVEGAEADEDAYDDAWRAFEAWKKANPGRADHVRRPAGSPWKEAEEREEEGDGGEAD